VGDYEAILEGHGIPPVDGKILEVRYVASSGDWHARTSEGWFYCRTQDVDPDRRKWVPSAYGPTD
jgi:hypothetical protein